MPVDMVKGVGSATRKKLEAVGVGTVARLLLHAPRRYLDRNQLFDIQAAPIGEEVTIGGVVERFDKIHISRGRTMIKVRVSDGTSTIDCVWFNPYKKATVGAEVLLGGKIELFNGRRQMTNPDMQEYGKVDSLLMGRVVPIHPSTGGLPLAKLRASMINALQRSLPMEDVVPADHLTALGLVDRSTAFMNIHFPNELRDVGPARKRLIFDEFLRIQMVFKAREHDEYVSRRGVPNVETGELTTQFIAHFPFELTSGQHDALESIKADMVAPTPMHRLLHGEVGSGKTVVVVIALLASVEGGHQGAVMAPTEVLATQHYLGTEQILRDAQMAPPEEDPAAGGTASLFGGQDPVTRPVRIGLFTGSRVTVNFIRGDVSRSQGLAWLDDGTIDIAFGTHALIQEDVAMRSLGLAVVDEQHRFGVEQRVQLRAARDDGAVPDLLLMTATPIPRTLAMVQYGDLKVSSIAEMPVGRVPVKTTAVAEGLEADRRVDEEVATHLAAGGQVFVVCPLIEHSDKIDARSAVSESVRMAAALPNARVALLHGQMSSDDKAETMLRFRNHELDVLVSTTVIEVGIDVPNATLIVVRNAERFGLSQLHQLRGRVGRGDQPGTCVLAVDASTGDADARISAMLESNDGYVLAERDLEIRGQGKVFGESQSGATDLRLGDILRDADVLDSAARLAADAIKNDRNSVFVEAVLDEADRFLGFLPEAVEAGVEL
ncbi:MAG: ATP-dependent DNA helicase RecG [Acidimicrobiia bacterium]|nr:ATP-dependent DNA helicase RecG [Acidimicrobiia bacterium]